MNWLFDNFQILLVLGLALAAWLKNRSESKAEEESERRAREDMIRGLKELKEQNGGGPIERQIPPVPAAQGQRWDTRPETAAPAPPPLPVEREEPQLKPVAWEEPDADDIAYRNQPSPWEQFQHRDSSHTEIGDATDPMESPLLQRQREMQERLARIKREASRQVAGARETQRRLERKGREEMAEMPGIASVVRDRRQTRRAIVLNEILGKPLALRQAAGR